jgi:hypothetical protein
LLTGHLRCCAAPSAPSGPRDLTKPRRPEKAGKVLPSGVPPASCVAVPAPQPRPWRTKGEGLDEVARRALLALVGARRAADRRSSWALDSCVGGTGAEEGQARVTRIGECVLLLPFVRG